MLLLKISNKWRNKKYKRARDNYYYIKMNDYYLKVVYSFISAIIITKRRKMKIIVNIIVKYLDKDKIIWNDIDRLRMALGLEILIYNIIMIWTILLMAWITKIFLKSIILLSTYGALKMSAGGVHFKKSYACLFGTGIFVWTGVWISDQLNIKLSFTTLIYLVCLIVLIMIGPQGTKNNPISKEHYDKLRKRTVFLVLLYLFATFFWKNSMGEIPYLLFIAVVFETLSLIPSYLKNRRT